MRRHWDEQELAEGWSLTHDELELLRNRTERSRLGFAVLLKFFQAEGRFPTERKEVPAVALDYVAAQVETSRDVFSEYDGPRERSWPRVRLVGASHGSRATSTSVGGICRLAGSNPTFFRGFAHTNFCTCGWI